MSNEKDQNKDDFQWPTSVSGTTENYKEGDTPGLLTSGGINNVFECMNGISIEFNEKYTVKEKLISVVTQSGGYGVSGTTSTFGSVAFHVTSMETNKSRRLMNLEILHNRDFVSEISIFTNSGRDVIGIARSCQELKQLFLKAITDHRITLQLKQLRIRND